MKTIITLTFLLFSLLACGNAATTLPAKAAAADTIPADTPLSIEMDINL